MVRVNFGVREIIVSDKFAGELIRDHDFDNCDAQELVARVGAGAAAALWAAQIQYRQGKNRDESRSRFPLHEFEVSAA